jgi:hypothetical protein
MIAFNKVGGFALAALLLFAVPLEVAAKGGSRGGGKSGGSVGVRGHTTRSGTYVAPHHRSAPDGSKLNNWSTKGNVNPYTSKRGTHSP